MMDPVLIINDSVEEARRASPPAGSRPRSVTAEFFDSFKTRFSHSSERTESTNYEDPSSPDEFGTSNNNDSDKYRTLTTFSGVFAPVALSMFAPLFLRLGFILGNSGLYLTIFQLILAYVILFFTVLSVCSIATNGAIQGGGVYFMISRAMGPEFGGAIGTLFFTANVFSSALYLTGCVEGIMNNFGPSGDIAQFLPTGFWWKVLYGSALNLLNVIICLIGASLFAKTSVMIFGILLVCIGSVIVSLLTRHHLDISVPHENWKYINETLVFTGVSLRTFQENLKPNFTVDYSTDYQITSFASVFGVLFSGVTGIMAGANISGELKDPNNSIPKGTIRAMVFTFVTYLILFFSTALSCSRNLLINNYIYMQAIDYVPVLVAIGLFSATFSASLSNLIGASRVLEALSKDKLFGPILNPVNRYSAPGNPISAVLITWLLIQLIILMNKLNLIAQITSVFFLLSYFATNFACLSLTLTSAPNFRPTFKYFDWKTATIGIIGTLVMMFVINPIYAAVTILLCLLLVVVLHIRSPPFRWGSITQALIFHQVRKYLLILDSRKDHVKYWRPHILLMVSNPRSCIPLIRFANDLKKSGLFIIGHVKRENLDDYDVDPVLKESPLWLKLLDLLAVKAFFELTLAPTVREGFHHLVRMTGLGAMKPNTVFLGFYDNEPSVDFLENDPYISGMISDEANAFPPLSTGDEEKNLSENDYTMMIYETIFKFKKNICIGRHFNTFQRDQIPKMKNKIIDIWPVDFFHRMEELSDNSWKFMLQLACIIKMVPDWKQTTKLRLLMSYKFENHEQLKSRWQRRLKKLRIECQLEIVSWNEDIFGNYDIDYYNSTQEEKSKYFTNVNRFVCEHSSQSTLIFLYLPAPFVNRNSNNNDYLKNLATITGGNLPPTILAHGITEVTSDSL